MWKRVSFFVSLNLLIVALVVICRVFFLPQPVVLWKTWHPWGHTECTEQAKAAQHVALPGSVSLLDGAEICFCLLDAT